MSLNQFDLVGSVQPEELNTTATKWKSRRTGLQVVLVDRESPNVDAHLVVASEANDNSGCPHTLEHIVFMGTKQRPFRGFLDKVAESQLSSINAYTMQDKTCYTLTSAGYEGFLNTLPVFLDNVLNATVLDEACLTEVYHVNESGEEKGVVFCEMQSHELTSYTAINDEMKRLLFNKQSGYATNTGGMLSALRTLKPETIRQYHKSVYKPDNLLVLVAGSINKEKLLTTLSEFDQTLPAKTAKSPKPFVDSKLTNQPSLLTGHVYSTVEFPDSFGGPGDLMVAWLGPKSDDLLNNTALEVINFYLTLEYAGKLDKNFIEVDDAIASYVYAEIESYLESLITLWFSGVESENSERAGHMIMDYLNGGILKDFDFELIKVAIKHLYDHYVSSDENSWETVGDSVETDFIYGDDNTFMKWVGGDGEFDKLKKWTENDWIAFIKEYIIERPKACIFGKPSQKLLEKVTEDNKEIRNKIKNSVDLNEAGAKLRAAIDKNNVPVPDELLAGFKVPNFNNIPFINTLSAPSAKLLRAVPTLNSSNSFNEVFSKDLVPNLAINFEQVKSQFVGIRVFVDPHQVDPHLFPLISVVLSAIFSMPMKLDDGTELSADDVIDQTAKDLKSSGLYVCDPMDEYMELSLSARKGNYGVAMEWLYRALFNVEFDEKKVAVALSKHLKNLADSKRSSQSLLYASSKETLLTSHSFNKMSKGLISEPLILEFQKDIAKTTELVTTVYKSIFRKETLRISVVADFISLKEQHSLNYIVDSWNKIGERILGDQNNSIHPIVLSNNFLTSEAKHPNKQSVITVNSGSDSSDMLVSTPGILDFQNEDLIGLSALSSFFESLEGPLGVAIRGSGLAYGVFIFCSVQMGAIQCHITTSSDALAAYEVCEKVINELATGVIEITVADVQSAAASVVSKMASILATPVLAANEKFDDVVLKGFAVDRIKTLLRKLSELTPTDFVYLLKKYILPLFDINKNTSFLTSPPSEAEQYHKRLVDLGYNVTIKKVQEPEDSEDDSEEDDSDLEE